MKTKVVLLGVISFLLCVWSTAFVFANVVEWAKLPVCLTGFMEVVIIFFFMVKEG